MANNDESERDARNLITAAQSTKSDLYDLFSLSDPTDPTTDASLPAFSAASLKKAWRTAALKYHPDKNRGAEKEAADKLDEVRKAYDILNDDAAREAYNAVRAKEREKRAREAAYDSKRRKLKEDLERRESEAAAATGGHKRTWDESNSEEAQRERQTAALAAKYRQKLLEREEKLRRQQEDASHHRAADSNNHPSPSVPPTSPDPPSDLSRTIKLRWPRDAQPSLDSAALTRLFSAYGPVDAVVPLEDKKARPSAPASASAKPKKTLMARAIVTFASIVAAHAAITDFAHLHTDDSPLRVFDAVDWASGAPPPLQPPRAAASPTPTPPAASSGQPTDGAATPAQPAASTAPSNGVSLRERAMMRLKEAAAAQQRLAAREESTSLPSAAVSAGETAPADLEAERARKREEAIAEIRRREELEERGVVVDAGED